MASVVHRKNGRKEIQFTGVDRRRRAIRLGRVSDRAAEAVCAKVEHLVAAAIVGHAPSSEVARWVADLSPELSAKLAAVGLIRRRERSTLATFLASYIGERTDAAPGTLLTLGTAKNRLVEFFGADKLLQDINSGDADRFVISLRTKGRAEPTVGRAIVHSRHFWAVAMRRGLADVNVFEHIKAPPQVNTSRGHHVSAADTLLLLDACPGEEWRLIIALCRYGGLRCPSELRILEWTDINWERGRFRVRAPKNRRHTDAGERWVPLFPELLPFLEAAFERAPEGAVKVLARPMGRATNLRTQLLKILGRAGMSPWPRLFQNLRASRETELVETFPVHVAAAWLGNSPKVAARHYLQVTEEHFRRGATGAQNPTHECEISRDRPV